MIIGIDTFLPCCKHVTSLKINKVIPNLTVITSSWCFEASSLGVQSLVFMIKLVEGSAGCAVSD